MAAQRTFTASELATRTGVPVPTLRYYVRIGLLPAPRRRGPRRVVFDERHARALRLIRALRARRRLPLPTIRRVLSELLSLGAEGLRPATWDQVIARHASSFDRTHDRLMRAAVRSFCRRGLASSGVAEIAEAAGVAKGTVYRHYRSKDELFFAAAASAAAWAGEELSAAPRTGSVDRTIQILADALAPYLPMLLELASGALGRRRGFARAMSDVLDALGACVRGRLPRGHRATGVAAEALGRAFADGVAA